MVIDSSEIVKLLETVRDILTDDSRSPEYACDECVEYINRFATEHGLTLQTEEEKYNAQR